MGRTLSAASCLAVGWLAAPVPAGAAGFPSPVVTVTALPLVVTPGATVTVTGTLHTEPPR